MRAASISPRGIPRCRQRRSRSSCARAPRPARIAGTIEATNAAIGTLDAGRVPLSAFSSRFAWRDDVLALESIAAALEGGGTITGQAQIPLGAAGTAGSWTLELRDIDLRQDLRAARRHPPFRERSSPISIGSSRGSAAMSPIARSRGGIALDFAAVLADGAVVVDRFRARSGQGRARRSRPRRPRRRARLRARRDRDALRSRRRTAHFPSGTLDGRIVATGTLAPPWRVRADLTLAQGSRLSGVALAGTARGTFTRDIRARCRDRSLRRPVEAHGDGRRRRDAAIASRSRSTRRDLAELAPLLPARVAQSLAGALHLKADFAGLPPQAGIDLEAKGERLKLPGGIAAGTAELRARIAPGATGDFRARPRDAKDRARRRGDADRHALRRRRHAARERRRNAGRACGDAGAEGRGLRCQRVGPRRIRHDARRPAASTTLAGRARSMRSRTAAHGRCASRRRPARARALARSHRRDASSPSPTATCSLTEFSWGDGGSRRPAASPPCRSRRSPARRYGAAVHLHADAVRRMGARGNAAPQRHARRAARRRRHRAHARHRAPIRRSPSASRRSKRARGSTTTRSTPRRSFRSTRGDRADAKLAVGKSRRRAARAPRAGSAARVLGERRHSRRCRSCSRGSAAPPWSRAARTSISRRAARCKQANLSGAVLGEGLRIDAPQYGVHYTNGRLAVRAAEGRVAVDEITLRRGRRHLPRVGRDHRARAGRRQARGAARVEGGEIPRVQPAGPAPRRRRRGHRRGARRQDHALRQARGRRRHDRLPRHTRRDARRRCRRQGLDAPRDRARCASTTFRSSSTCRSIWAIASRSPARASRRGSRAPFASRPVRAGFVGKGSIRTVRGTYFAFGQRLDDRSRAARLRRAARQSGPRHRRAAAKPRRRGGRGGHRNREGPGHPAHVESAGAGQRKAVVARAGTGRQRSLVGRRSRGVAGRVRRAPRLARQARLRVDRAVRSASTTSRSRALRADRAQPGTPGVENQVIAVGKRLTDRLTLVYEQGLTIATNALRLEYELTRSLTVRAEAGTVGAVGLYFRRTFD